MNAISYSYVALLDVLAYKRYLDRDRNAGTLEFQAAMKRALNVFANVNDVDFGYTAISDTIIVTCAHQQRVVPFLRLLKRIVHSFLNEGLFLRGAAVYSQHFHSGHLTYSPALTRAYEIEQAIAIYPRIVIDQNIVEMFRAADQSDILLSRLIVECNGVMFLNILDERNWNRTYEAARGLFKRDAQNLRGNESAFSKHGWFENYLFSSSFRTKGAKRYIPVPTILAL